VVGKVLEVAVAILALKHCHQKEGQQRQFVCRLLSVNPGLVRSRRRSRPHSGKDTALYLVLVNQVDFVAVSKTEWGKK